MSPIANTLFSSLFLTSFPFLLAGIAVSSFLAAFVKEGKFATFFPRGRVLGAIVGSLLGLLLPVGQYGTIPIARQFFRQNVPGAVVFSFLVAAPTLNVLTLWLTWQTFVERSSIFFYRSIAVWILAIAIGILFSYYRTQPKIKEEKPLESPEFFEEDLFPIEEDIEDRSGISDIIHDYKIKNSRQRSFLPNLSLFARNFTRETLEFGGLLIWGCTIASLFQLWLPQQQLLEWGQIPEAQILVMILFGFGLSVNSSLSVLVPGALTTTLFTGSFLAYFLPASLINIQGIPLLLASFSRKIVLYLVLLLLSFTFLISLILSFYLG